MSSHTCPVEGCDYGESSSKSLAAVRSHINASGDSEHDWDALKSEVTGEEEPDGEQTEADESEENGDTMPTDEEYQEQYDQGEEDGEQSSTSSSDFSLPALDQRTMMMLVAVGVALLVLYLYLNRDGDGAIEHAPAVEEEDGDSEALSNEEVTLLE